MKEYKFTCTGGGFLSRGEEYKIMSTELDRWSDRNYNYTQRYFIVEDKDHDAFLISRGELIDAGVSAYMLAKYVKEHG